MKMTRKLLCIALAILLILSCGACASAGEEPSPSLQEPPTMEMPGDVPTNTQGTQAPIPHTQEPAAPTAGADDIEPADDNGGAVAVAPVPSGDPTGQQTPPAETGAPERQEPQELPTPSEPVVLTIKGDGVSEETTWTLAQLQALRDGYRELTYSTTNNWPSYGHLSAHGVSLPYLLRQAGVEDGAASIKFSSTDGYNATLTYNQVFGTRYSYSTHSPAGSGGAFAVEPMVAWAWGDVGKVRDENIRPFFGQNGPWDVNTAFFVKNLNMIEVSTASAGNWAAPSLSIADGSNVASGTELEILHDSMDNVRIYYTLDGSEPDYNSPVYNQSASYYQPQLIKPLRLTESVTVKAFAAAYGKDRSPTAVCTYTVE